MSLIRSKRIIQLKIKQDQQTPDKDDKTNKDDHTNTQTIITDPNQQDEQPQHKEQDKQKVIKLDVPQSVQENNYFCVPACVQNGFTLS